MITNITETLAICDIRDVCERPTNEFDRIVTVCQDAVTANISARCTYRHIKLADGIRSAEDWGGRCDYPTFEAGADAVLAGLDAGERTLVHCHHGRSRSAAVAIAALGAHADIGYFDAYDRVADVREIDPDPLLTEHARTYLNGGKRCGG